MRARRELRVHHEVEVVTTNLNELNHSETGSFRDGLKREFVLVQEKVKVLQREQEGSTSNIGVKKRELISRGAAILKVK